MIKVYTNVLGVKLLAGMAVVRTTWLASPSFGRIGTSIIATFWDGGGAGSAGGWVDLTLIVMPLLRRRRVPRWTGFSFLLLAMWAWMGPEIYAVTNESPLRKLGFMLSCSSTQL